MSYYYVKIYYGPCRSNNEVLYRPRKLKGIKVALQKHGYRVDFIPVKWIDYCMLEMNGHEVFRCNIQNIKFNTCVERDPVAQRAVQAVLDGTDKTLRARSYLWNWELLEQHILLKGEYAPKEYFLPTMNIKPFENFNPKLTIKRCKKQAKQPKAIREKSSDDDDNSDDSESLSTYLPAPPPPSNKKDDENSKWVDNGKVDVDDNKGELNDEERICGYDNDVDEVDDREDCFE